MIRNRTSVKSLLGFIVGIATLLGGACVAEDDYMWVHGEINGKPVRMIFDTAASHSVIFEQSADRLGLTLHKPEGASAPRATDVLTGTFGPCNFKLWGNTVRPTFYSANVPSGSVQEGADGVLGWGMLGNNNRFWIDVSYGLITPLDQIPEVTRKWAKFKLESDSKVLALRIPNPEGTNVFVLDSGYTKGVALSPARWKQWRAKHPDAPATLDVYYNLGVGVVVVEVCWAKAIKVGPLTLENVSVCMANPAHTASAPNFEALLGVQALKQLVVVVDGKNEAAYVVAKARPQQKYDHNRIGAVFAPNDIQSSNYVAHVVKGGPADLAGVREGDVLLKINEVDYTRRPSNPKDRPRLNTFLESPAGTKLRLFLRRGEREITIDVTTKDILSAK